jgi:hypothetical protein
MTKCGPACECFCVAFCKLWLLCWWQKAVGAVCSAWICYTVDLLQYLISPNMNFSFSDVYYSNGTAWKIIDWWLKCLLIFVIANNEACWVLPCFSIFPLVKKCYWCKMWCTVQNKTYLWHAELCLPEQLAVHRIIGLFKEEIVFKHCILKKYTSFGSKTYKLCYVSGCMCGTSTVRTCDS